MDAVCHIGCAAVFKVNACQHLLFLGRQALQSLSHPVCNHIQLGFFKRRPAGNSQHISPGYACRIGIVQRKTFCAVLHMQKVKHSAADAVHGKYAESNAAFIIITLRRLQQPEHAFLHKLHCLLFGQLEPGRRFKNQRLVRRHQFIIRLLVTSGIALPKLRFFLTGKQRRFLQLCQIFFQHGHTFLKY